MLPRPSECRPCPLNHSATGFSKSDGTCSNGVLAIAEALGSHEAADGLPLREHAQAGGVFHRALVINGYQRESFGLWNTIGCQPPNNYLDGAPYEFGAINHCRVHMDQVVDRFRPKLILALGKIPTRTLTGMASGTPGAKTALTSVRGYVLEGTRYPEIPVIGTYHPSYIARGKSNVFGVLVSDIRAAVRLAGTGVARPKINILWQPSVEVRKAFLKYLADNPQAIVYYDIETEDSTLADEADLRVLPDGQVEQTIRPEEAVDDAPDAPEDQSEEIVEVQSQNTEKLVRNAQITQIQFAVSEKTGLVMRFQGEFVEFARAVMATPNPKVGVNSDCFDDPLLWRAGFQFGARSFDLMKLYNHIQPDLPRGLQYIVSFEWPELGPWKHLATQDFAAYGVRDVVAPARVFPRYVERAKELGVWDGFLRNVHNLHTLRVRCSQRGMPVDTHRQRELDQVIAAEEQKVWWQLQEIYPKEIRRVEPREGYLNPRQAEHLKATLVLDPGEYWEQREFSTTTPQELKRAEKRAWKMEKSEAKRKAKEDLRLERYRQRMEAREARDRARAEARKVREAENAAKALKKKEPKRRKGETEEEHSARIAIWYTRRSQPPAVQMDLFSDEAVAEEAEARQELEIEIESPEEIVEAAQVISTIPPAEPSASSITRWCRVQPYKPNSAKQIITYLQWAGVPPPRAAKAKVHGDDPPLTTAKVELKKLCKNHPKVAPLIENSILYKEFNKVRSTYIHGWPVQLHDPQGLERPPDLTPEETEIWNRIGYVHPTFVPWPATGQTGARNPNTTNVLAPKGAVEDNRSRLAKAIRAVVVPKPRRVLIDFDWKAFHVLTTGFNAKDPDYMWLARRDPHAYIAGQMLKVDGHERWREMIRSRDEELVEILKWWKKQDRLFLGQPFIWHRNRKAKPAILGVGFGLEANTLWLQNYEAFRSRKDAQDLIDQIMIEFPKVAEFQNFIIDLAATQKKLVSPHGYVRWFWNVWHWQIVKSDYQPRRGEKVFIGKDNRLRRREKGEDAKAALAFLPANNAFGHKHDCLWEMERLGLLERYAWCNDEHDALKFHCPANLADECLEKIPQIMQMSSAVLINEAAPDGLWCAVEATVGKDWGNMGEARIVERKD